MKRIKLISIWLTLLILVLSACQSTTTDNTLPTLVADTSITAEATAEATAEVTAEATAEVTAEATAEATAETTAEVTESPEITTTPDTVSGLEVTLEGLPGVTAADLTQIALDILATPAIPLDETVLLPELNFDTNLDGLPLGTIVFLVGKVEIKDDQAKLILNNNEVLDEILLDIPVEMLEIFDGKKVSITGPLGQVNDAFNVQVQGIELLSGSLVSDGSIPGSAPLDERNPVAWGQYIETVEVDAEQFSALTAYEILEAYNADLLQPKALRLLRNTPDSSWQFGFEAPDKSFTILTLSPNGNIYIADNLSSEIIPLDQMIDIDIAKVKTDSSALIPLMDEANIDTEIETPNIYLSQRANQLFWVVNSIQIPEALSLAADE